MNHKKWKVYRRFTTSYTAHNFWRNRKLQPTRSSWVGPKWLLYPLHLKWPGVFLSDHLMHARVCLGLREQLPNNCSITVGTDYQRRRDYVTTRTYASTSQRPPLSYA